MRDKMLILLLFIFCFASTAYANVAILPVVTYMTFPLNVILMTSGWLFSLIIVIEMFILQRTEKINLFESLKLSFLANLFSSFIGLCIAFSYLMGSFSLIGAAIGAHWFTSLFVDLSEKTGKFQTLAGRRKLCFWLFFIGGVLSAFLGMLIMPNRGVYRHKNEFTTPDDIVIAMLGAVFLLVSGFLLSCISEGYLLAKKISIDNPNIIRTVLFMNFASYVILFLSVVFALL